VEGRRVAHCGTRFRPAPSKPDGQLSLHPAFPHNMLIIWLCQFLQVFQFSGHIAHEV
jgi:hypothetical protein